MNERVRQQYLTQMGVAVWYSRCELPGAAASPEFDFGVFEQPVSEGSEAGATDVVMVKSAADILSNLSSSVVADLKPVEQKEAGPLRQVESGVAAEDSNITSSQAESAQPSASPAVVPIAVPIAPATLKSIDLTLWVGTHNWFLSDSDAEFPDQLKHQLLFNIAAALGESIDKATAANFSWPFFGNVRLPGNDAASMLRLLTEWLERQLHSSSLNGFLMGEGIVHTLLRKSLPDVAGKELELDLNDERNLTVVPTLSLNDLLRDSSNKRLLWQHVKRFRKIG